MKIPKILVATLCVNFLTACGTTGGASLVFGQQQVVGITIAGSGPAQEAEFTLGYKDKNIAVVPVAIKQDDGTYQELRSGIGQGKNSSGSTSDAYSTFGQFEVTASNDSGGPTVGLGKFFATGTAAQVISQGFREKLAGTSNNKDIEDSTGSSE